MLRRMAWPAVSARLSMALLVISLTHRRQLVRGEGLLLLLTYLGYMTWRAWPS